MNRTAVVTGAGAGVGKATAIALLDAGWNVVLCGRTLTTLEAVVASRQPGSKGSALAVSCDVANPSDVGHLFETVVREFGRVDLLFNNAGASYPSALIDEIPLDVWHQVVSVNLTGSFLCAREAFRIMRTQQPQGGRIINNGSISAHVPRPGSVPYTATKHAISGLTKTLALDGRPYAIACGQIDIGNAATNMTSRMAAGALQADGSKRPEPCIDVSDVANAVLYMASLPLNANVLTMTVMASDMPYVGRG